MEYFIIVQESWVLIDESKIIWTFSLKELGLSMESHFCLRPYANKEGEELMLAGNYFGEIIT